jgi:chromatin remodeling complex protein RSC6
MSVSVSASKSKMPKKIVAETPAPSVAPAAAAPAKTSKAAVPAKAEVTVPVVASVPVEVAAPAETRHASEILADLQEQIKALGSELTTRVRALVAQALETAKALKRDARDSKKRHRKNPEDMSAEERTAWEARRANNAFLKQRPISDELASFMGLPAKSLRSQTDVTKFVATYVKTHNCFDPSFKRRIVPDTKLGKLLRVKDGQEVTYLNLQSFLKVHFLKPTA